MKILIAPLNWGLGHASRCIPLIRQFLSNGQEVWIGGDGDSLELLKKTFPTLPVIGLSQLELRYASGKSQVWAMIRNLPKLIRSIVLDHQMTRVLDCTQHFDMIISDNRFGLYPPKKRKNSHTRYIYITHQLHIRLPQNQRWAEEMAERWHRSIYSRYDEVWVPDYEERERALAGELSHPAHTDARIQYIGPLSRMERGEKIDATYDIVAVLSGLEPQRSILEEQIIQAYNGREEKVLIVQGKIHESKVLLTHNNISKVPYLKDEELIPILLGSRKIIARSGYSTIMDLERLGLLDKAELIPTPGQSEQEYLYEHLKTRAHKRKLS